MNKPCLGVVILLVYIDIYFIEVAASGRNLSAQL